MQPEVLLGECCTHKQNYWRHSFQLGSCSHG